MTNKEAIARIKDHIKVHHIKEDRAIKIVQALNMVIEALERTEWHYPSRGEYPTEGDRQYFCKLKMQLGDWSQDWYEVVGWTGKYWILNDDEQVIAWQYIIPPKEEA